MGKDDEIKPTARVDDWNKSAKRMVSRAIGQKQPEAKAGGFVQSRVLGKQRVIISPT